MEISSGRVFGSILLVAGCCIGAGMLGLPVLSAESGFIPSSVMFTLVWLFMMSSGLLLLEVNLWFENDISIITMAKKTLGIAGQAICWFLFVFLFYSIMVAYVAASGSLFSGVADDFALMIPKWFGSVLFTVLFGLLIYFGTRYVDRFNRFLMLGLIVSYSCLVVLGVQFINLDNLLHENWIATTIAIPVMVISFGYHNLIPSLTTYLGRNKNKLILVVMIGSFIPLSMYLAWQGMVLGIVPPEGFQKTLESGEIVTAALKEVVNSKAVLLLAEHFAFFAIVSSFLSVALSFLDFLADGFNIKKDAKGKALLCFLTLVPPFIFAFLYPNIFLTSLNYAGAYGAVVLFGVIPVLMVWKGRYIEKIESPTILPGGKISLASVMFVAMAIVTIKLLEDLQII